MNQSDMENSLRDMLAERADRMAPNDLLAQKIIKQATAGAAAPDQLTRRRGWMLPLLTAAAVVAVVAGTLTATSLHSSTTGGHPSGQAPRHLAAPAPTVTATPSISPTQSTFTDASDLATTADSSATAIGLENFTAVDLTFVGTNIWALGTATCLKSGQGLCTAFVHSSDGTHWTTIQSTPFNVPGDTDTNDCALRCVEHMRFASDKIGYVFGPDALLMTLDGGKSWQVEQGGAVALETLDGNVIRVEESAGCPPGCAYTVQRAPIGSTHWTSVPISVPVQDSDGVQLSRNGSDAYLLFTAHTDGGAESAHSTLFTSTDDGASWFNHGEPCQQSTGETDAVGVLGVNDDAIVVACQPRQQRTGVHATVGYGQVVEEKHYESRGLPSVPITLLGAGAEQNICVEAGTLYCSQNYGGTFSKTQGSHGGPGTVSFIGFEDATDGHALEIDKSAANGAVSNLWTTTDGGKTWSVGSIAS
jgi:photosystem II stability/assembly factor-like uncharacterized protein